MRISDWSSDVCSSDLPDRLARAEHQRAGVDIRDIAEALGLGLDQRARRRADAGFVVERARYRIGRQPDGLRQILKSGLTTPLDHIRHARASNFDRSEEHTSELQSLMRISYAVFCLKKKNITNELTPITTHN